MKIVVKEKYFNIRKTKYNRKIGLKFLKNFNVQSLKEYKLDFLATKCHHSISAHSGMEKYKVFQKLK